MRHLYKMLAVFALLLSVGTAQAQYSIGLALSAADVAPFLAIEGSFGPRLPYNEEDAIIGQLVEIRAIKGDSTSTACDTIVEDLTGKIAIIDRGTCGFVAKCLNAVKKGAVAVLVTNKLASSTWGVMGGAADPLAAKITVPCLMLSRLTGIDVKAFVANSTGPVFCGLWHPNAYSGDSYTIKAGNKYFVDGNDGHPFAGQLTAFPKNGALDTIAAKQARFFVYNPTQSGKISVSSCGGKGNTHLNIHEVAAQAITKTWSNGGACAKDATDTQKTAAELKDVPVTAGLSYYLEFTDKDSKDSFYFSMGFVKRDSVTIKLSVDMKSETAVDAAGVHVAGNFQGWDPKKSALKNVAGTKVYEGTFKVAADQTIEYKFVNGDAWSKDESVANTAPCAAGKDGNRKLVVKTEDASVATVCFKSCDACITPAADLTCNAAAVICDPFKTYSNGALAKGTAAHWSVWNDDYVGAGPAYISSNQFSSDTKSMLIDFTLPIPQQDAILKLGNVNKGHYNLDWKLYVPIKTIGTKKSSYAYYNLQHDITGDHVWAADVHFLSNKRGQVQIGTAVVATFGYTPDTWVNISHDIDIDKDTVIMSIGTEKVGWKWSRASGVAGVLPSKVLAGVDFYATGDSCKYYIDDVQLIKLPDPKAKVTFSVDMKNETVDAAKGVCVAGNFQAAAGLGADWTPGAAKLVNKAGTSIWELTTELPTGNYEFKFINDNTWDNKKEEKMAGKGCYAGDNRTFSLTDLNAKTVGTYCYNSCYACNQREVTFIVDMSKEATVFSKGVSIAGDFQAAAGQGANWTPGVLYATKTTGRIYVAKAGIPAGTYSYKFVNSDSWNNKDEKVKDTDPCAAGKDGNRKLVVGTVDMKLDTVCFKHCVICSKVVSTNDPKFDSAMTLYPNPAQDIINLNYEFNATTSLKVNLVNILGQTVYTADMPEVTSGTAILDIHNLTSGTYMIQITDQNSRQSVKRFVIER